MAEPVPHTIAPPANAAPRIVGRYAIYEAIASGGMATVHYGRLLGPVGFSRTVAIKRLHPQFAQDPEFVTMFLDEARLAARIRHPNVVGTLDVVAASSEIFLVMDYVHGEALSRIFREVTSKDETVPLPIALRIATDALQGLHAAHEAHDERGTPLNIVHRDISPQNILIGVDGIARLVDFGVAKASGRSHTTRDGNIKGKLSYMAPEQLLEQKVTRQADIHGLAVVLWEMLTGRRLFAGGSEAETIGLVMRHNIPPVVKFVPTMPASVDAVLRRGLTSNLDRRFATAHDMCIALEACGPIAPPRQVTEWALKHIKQVIEERNSVVRGIEQMEDSVPNTNAKEEPPGSTASPEAWVARLSAPDLDAAAEEGRRIVDEQKASGTATRPAPEAEKPAGAESALPRGPEREVRKPAETVVESEIDVVPLARAPRGLIWGGAATGVAVLLVAATWTVASRQATPPGVAAQAAIAVSPASAPPVSVPSAGAATAAPPAASTSPVSADPSTTPLVASSATSPATRPAHVTPPRPAGATPRATPKPDCNPPFTIDSNGVRFPKRECFN